MMWDSSLCFLSNLNKVILFYYRYSSHLMISFLIKDVLFYSSNKQINLKNLN